MCSSDLIAVKMFANAQLLVLAFAWELGHGGPEWFAEIAGRTAAGHRAVYEAIRRRDGKAAREAMAAHVTWARQEVPEHYAAVAGGQPISIS